MWCSFLSTFEAYLDLIFLGDRGITEVFFVMFIGILLSFLDPNSVLQIEAWLLLLSTPYKAQYVSFSTLFGDVF